MSSLTEILLIIVVTTLTLTLTIIGVQLFLILRDVRERIIKLDPILDNVVVEQEHLNEILISAKDSSKRINETTSYLSDEVIHPIGNILSAVKGISQLIEPFRARRQTRRDSLEEDYDEDERI